MVDIEFGVQFLVLSQGYRHPELLANAGNIGLGNVLKPAGGRRQHR
ncbi:hypothetical protein [Candidatus Aalborgicola defluviihabitans]